MGFPTRAAILGAKVKFFRAGVPYTEPVNGTVSETALPDFDDPSGIIIGKILDASITPTREEVEIEATSPVEDEYTVGRVDVINRKNNIDLAFTSYEFSPTAIQIIFGTPQLTASSTTFAPLSFPDQRGWIYFLSGDHLNKLLIDVTFFGIIKVDGEVKFGGLDPFQVRYTFKSFRNVLATGKAPYTA